MIDPHEHVGMVFKLARKYASEQGREDYGVFVGPLYQLLCAVARTFDPARGTTFSTLFYRSAWYQARTEIPAREDLLKRVGGKKNSHWAKLPTTGLCYLNDDPAGQVEPEEYREHEEPNWGAIHPHAWEIARLRTAGFKLSEIGEHVGLSSERVRQILYQIAEEMQAA